MFTHSGCLILVFSISMALAQFSGGDGSLGNPYKVSTPDDLALLDKYKGQNLYFIQTKDIDLTGYLDTCAVTGGSGWIPIGKNGSPFKGNYDGAGFTISGLWIDRPDMEFVGLFGFAYEDTISNLTIKTSESKGVTGGTVVGALCGNVSGVITHCYVSGSVKGREQVGAVAGATWGVIDHTSATATVIATVKCGGGISGTFVNSGRIQFCHSNCSVSGGDQLGGLVGSSAGGVSGMVTNSFSEGSVSGTIRLGGIVGLNSMKIYNCYSLSIVSGDSVCGGIAGSNSGTINECCYLKEKEINSSLPGVGLDSTNQIRYTRSGSRDILKDRNTFLSWDFDYVWTFDSSRNNGYPYPSLKPIGQIFRGQGSAIDPFIVETPQQLQALTYFGEDSTLFFRLGSDIDLSDYLSSITEGGYNGGMGWLPINRFNGKLDGAHHTIKGLMIVRPFEVYTGLILFCNGTITALNIGLAPESGITGLNESGILCSEALSNACITNCNTSGNVTATDMIAGDNSINKFVGGIAGRNRGRIENCHSSANCYFEQKDSIVDSRDGAGGLVGYNDMGTIHNCSATGKLVCKSTNAGGLVGQNLGTITNSHSTASVTVTGRGINAGGFTGIHGKPVGTRLNTGIILRCFSTGTVTATGTYAKAGSFAGTVKTYGDSALIQDAYATGNIMVDGNSVEAGGFVGANGGKLIHCYFAGHLDAPGDGYQTGGFVGVNNRTIAGCYHLESTNSNAVKRSIGTDYDSITPELQKIKSVTETRLKQKSTFEGWDFDNVWTIEESVSYPTLREQPNMISHQVQAKLPRSRCQISTAGHNSLAFCIPENMGLMQLQIYNSRGQLLSRCENLCGTGIYHLSKMPSGWYIAALKNRSTTTGAVRTFLVY